MTDPNAALMVMIRSKWGAAIAAACAASAVPESFLAALVANESGGDPSKTRFEPGNFAEMCEVMAGKRAHFESLGSQDLFPPVAWTLSAGLARMVSFATSYGLTQIMGFQVLPFHRSLAILTDTAEHLKFAVELLEQFAARWDLKLDEGADRVLPGSDLNKLFACWNCGQPFPEKTFDPHYCANGILRMGLYPAAAAPTVESV